MPLPASRAFYRQRHRPQRARHLVRYRPPIIACQSASTLASCSNNAVSCTPLASSIPTPTTSCRSTVRRWLRQRRRQLSPQQQRLAAQGAVHQLLSHGMLRRAQRVALYLPADGELDPTPLLRTLTDCGIKAYVPVLHPLSVPHLWFVQLTPETYLVPNRYGLLEPVRPWRAQRANRCSAWALDMVLMPLVGFDARGARMGMGGGFYDRTFSRKQYQKGKWPRLIGLAHDEQEVAQLPTASWDVPLDVIVTGTRCLRAISGTKAAAAAQKTAPRRIRT